MMARNVILVDFAADSKWEFQTAIEEKTGQTWDIKYNVTNRLHGAWYKNLLRYLHYFLFSFKVFRDRDQYDNIIAWQQFYGLLLVFYCRFFKTKQVPNIYIMTFIYKGKKIFLYHKLMQYIVTSGYIKRFIVYSDSEKEYYSKIFHIDPNLFHCTRIGVPDVSAKFKQKKNREKYYLSVGRSNRDYTFLRNAWKKEYGKLIIICDSYKESDKDGIVCLSNCYGDEYIQKVADCYAEIIPLQDTNIASGSLSFLQAMMLSKPTIVTENITVHDYIKSGYNGYIIQKSESELSKVITELNNEEKYAAIARNARKEYVDRFSEYALGIDVANMIMTTSANK